MTDPEAARDADGLILPGVGAFPEAMSRIRAQGFDELISERAAAGVPVLGICLGMQLIFGSSTELEGAEGLGLLDGDVTDLDAKGQKVPHIGWSPVTWTRESPLTEGLDPEEPFYFVHSLASRPAERRRHAGHRDLRRDLRRRRRAGQRLRRPVPPGEVELGGPAAARELRGDL